MKTMNSLPATENFVAAHRPALKPWERSARWALAAIGLCAALMNPAYGAGVKEGPFEIEFRFERRMGSFPNGDPFKSHQIARYKLLHNGRTVAINPGGVDPLKHKWLAGDLLEAHFVYSKGLPVVLVCTETGTYVVSDRGGKPWVQQLADQPATRYQFFDSVAGQPGDLESLNAGPEEASMGRDLGREGTLMSLHDAQNNNFGVLDLNTLQLRVLSVLKRHRFVYEDPEFDGFTYDASAQGQVRVWWKDKRQFALVRNRHVGDTKSFALELVNLDEDTFYMVPFDLNRTRLIALGDVSMAWIGHYFQWAPDASQAAGSAKLRPRQIASPLPWQGTTQADPYRRATFNLQPVLPEMKTVLLQFLSDKFGAVSDGSTRLPSTAGLTIQKQAFTLFYYEPSNSLTLSWDSVGPGALIAQIADQFNREIKQSRYQALFTTLGPGGFSR